MDATAASRATPQPDAANASAAPSTAVYDKQLAWKLHGQRKLQHAADALRSREEEHCTFSPKTNRQSPPPSLVLSPRSDRSSASVGGYSAESPRSSPCSPRPSTIDSCSASASAGGVHPTDAQESSILLHFARQERARGFVHVAQQKLASTMPGKDFSKTTKPAPFALSASNWKPRQSTPTDGGKAISPGRVAATALALPSDQQQQADCAEGGVSAQPSPPAAAAAVQPASKVRTKHSGGAKHSNNHSRPASTRSVTADDAWETERATLVAVLDAQRRELALRARAQADAVRAAESFASATQRFEERLAALESRTADELREIRRLLARQAAASDLILRSLGLALPPEPPSGAAEGGKTL